MPNYIPSSVAQRKVVAPAGSMTSSGSSAGSVVDRVKASTAGKLPTELSSEMISFVDRMKQKKSGSSSLESPEVVPLDDEEVQSEPSGSSAFMLFGLAAVAVGVGYYFFKIQVPEK